ncbi:unnamed protein product [Linum tenue]|uniref:Uncharacterized protein n=1 Tax=Linum tenue TaxID=586396 RepID=A0AAV0KNJ4_9ROSI|nr:unnamed protein product [Linum tenue]
MHTAETCYFRRNTAIKHIWNAAWNINYQNASAWCIKDPPEERYLSCSLTSARHSLGSGVTVMLALVVVLNFGKLGNIKRKRVRRLNVHRMILAADCDAVFAVPAMPKVHEGNLYLRSPDDLRRVYASDRLYHIVERKPFCFN